MTCYDVFNGDADGLCALHQLRLASPRDAVLVTGVKRDIALLSRVQAQAGDSVTVLDISLDVNRSALVDLLGRGVEITWFDHHFAGDIPRHPGLAATIDPAPDVCTGMLVDRAIAGRHRPWAVVAAFGDNLPAGAAALADLLGLSASQRHELQELGGALSYNAYGESEADLVVPPAALYRSISRYADPFRFLAQESVYARIRESELADLEHARSLAPSWTLPRANIYLLPEAHWSRRVHGVFGNELAQRHPERAHAVLAPDTRGGYTVSVRAPLRNPNGADRLCRRFASGGGRAAAAGINHLSAGLLSAFVQAMEEAYP